MLQRVACIDIAECGQCKGDQTPTLFQCSFLAIEERLTGSVSLPYESCNFRLFIIMKDIMQL
jgi:hypothetical protein